MRQQLVLDLFGSHGGGARVFRGNIECAENCRCEILERVGVSIGFLCKRIRRGNSACYFGYDFSDVIDFVIALNLCFLYSCVGVVFLPL